MKWFTIIFTLLCLTACSIIPPEATAHAETYPAETNETVTEEPSAAVVLPEDITAQAEVLTDHLIRFVMTSEWLEEPFEYTDENIFRFLVSLSMYREKTEHPYSNVITLTEDGRDYCIGLPDIQNIACEVFGEENWLAVSYTDELFDDTLPGYRIVSEVGLWSSRYSAENTTVYTKDSFIYMECDLVNSSLYEYETKEYGRWTFVYEYTASGQDGFLRFCGICAADDGHLTDPEMSGEPIGPILLNAMNGYEAYDGDISTDGLFSAEWNLTAADGERLISFTGKPEIYQLELFSDHVCLSSSGTSWDMFVTDRTMSDLMEDAFEQYNADETVTVNEFMRFSVTTENGDTIPLTVVRLEKGGAHISEAKFYFDRTITEDAVLFSMECFLPAGVEPEQYPALYVYNRKYRLWEADNDLPEQIDDLSMSVTFRRDSGYDFRISESSGCARWFDAELYNTSLYLTTDAALSGELYEILKGCSRTEWDDIGEYETEVCRKTLLDILKLTVTTQGRSSRVRPWLTVQENADGSTTFILENVDYEEMVSGTLEIGLP